MPRVGPHSAAGLAVQDRRGRQVLGGLLRPANETVHVAEIAEDPSLQLHRTSPASQSKRAGELLGRRGVLAHQPVAVGEAQPHRGLRGRLVVAGRAQAGQAAASQSMSYRRSGNAAQRVEPATMPFPAGRARRRAG